MSNKECWDCGHETTVDGYLLRVVNTSDDTLFLSPCIVECVKFMESSGLTMQGYRIEVMAYAG